MANTPPQGFTTLPGSERKLPAHAQQIKPVAADEQIEVSVYLRDPATSPLTPDINAHAQQPGQQMSRAEYNARHSAAPADLARVKQFAQTYHLTIVETDPVARKVVLSGTVGALTTAFATELHHYEQAGRTFRGRSGYLHVPDALDQIIVGVFGLDDRPQSRPQVRFAAPQALATSYTPPQVAQLYDFPTDRVLSFSAPT